jgi:hypothetical protein
MFGWQKYGSDLITEALAKFESIATDIEQGVADIEHEINAAETAIAELSSESDTLYDLQQRGKATAKRLRELVG